MHPDSMNVDEDINRESNASPVKVFLPSNENSSFLESVPLAHSDSLTQDIPVIGSRTTDHGPSPASDPLELSAEVDILQTSAGYFCDNAEQEIHRKYKQEQDKSSLIVQSTMGASQLSTSIPSGHNENQAGDVKPTGFDSVPSPVPAPLILQALEKLQTTLPSPWVPVADEIGIHLLQLSHGNPKAIQKEIFMLFNGVEEIWVHQILQSADIFNSVQPSATRFQGDTLEIFCRRARNLVMNTNQFTVCVGADDLSCKDLWSAMPNAQVDKNIYKEDSYEETCRSMDCTRLFRSRQSKRMCDSCAKLKKSIRRKALAVSEESASPYVNNRFLSNEQAIQKLKELQQVIKRKDNRIAYLAMKKKKEETFVRI